MDDARNLCPMDKATPESQIMSNVFRKYFAQKIQPWISQLMRFGQAMEPQLASIVSNHNPMTIYYERIYLNKDGPWQTFKANWEAHVQAWQRHMANCRLMPRSADDVKTDSAL